MRTVLVAIALVTGIAPAAADTGGDLAAANADDAAAHRITILPTGSIEPAGTVSADLDTVLGVVGAVTVRASLHDRVEVSASAGWAYLGFAEASDSHVLGAGLRVAVLRTGRSAVALHAGAMTGARDPSMPDDHTDAQRRLSGGAAASRCLDAACRAVGHVTVTYIHASERGEFEDTWRHHHELLGAGAVTWGRRWRLVAGAGVAATDGANPDGLGPFGYAGARYARRRVSVDLGAVAGLATYVPLPVLSVTARF